MHFLCEETDNTWFRIIDNYFESIKKASIYISRRTNFYILCRSKVIDVTRKDEWLIMSITYDLRKIKNLLLLKMEHCWQESFDGDSFVSQSRFDAYTSLYTLLSLIRILNCLLGLNYLNCFRF